MSEQAQTLLAPLDALLADPSVYEIFVDGFERVYVERAGGLEDVPSPFRSNEHLMEVTSQLVDSVGGEAQPMFDLRLPDGARVNVVLPPVSSLGPVLTIRKFFRERMQPEDLVSFGTWSKEILEVMNACVAGRLNILISGGSASGRYALLNVIASAMLPEDERIIVVGEGGDIQLPQKYALTLESQPANRDGQGGISVSALIHNALRMRPDRLVAEEVRGPEMMELLQAMNNGLDGLLMTVHASGPRDALRRLETMASLAPLPLPSSSLREMLSAAIDLIIHEERLRDGSRRVMAVTEVRGMQGNTILTEDLFVFQPTHMEEGRILGHFTATGRTPAFLNRLREEGIELSEALFKPRA